MQGKCKLIKAIESIESNKSYNLSKKINKESKNNITKSIDIAFYMC